MNSFTNGIYITKNNEFIVLLSNVKCYEDLKSRFWIVTYEYHDGVYPKTLLTEDDLKSFKRMGSL